VRDIREMDQMFADREAIGKVVIDVD